MSRPTSPPPPSSPTPQGRTAARAQHLAHRRLRRLARLPPDPLRGPERARLHHLLGRFKLPSSCAYRHHLLPHHHQGEPAASPTPPPGSPAAPATTTLLRSTSAAISLNGLQFRGNYTWSKKPRQRLRVEHQRRRPTLQPSSPIPANPALDYGPAATDIRTSRRHQRHLRTALRPRPTPLLVSIAIRLTAPSPAGPSAPSQAFRAGFPFSPQLGYNPTGSGDTRNPVRPNVNPNFTGSLYTRGTPGPRRPVLQPRRLLRARLRHRRQPRPRHPHRPRLHRLGPLAAQSPPSSAKRTRAPVPRRVLQHPQPHQSSDSERGRLHLRPHSGHDGQPDRCLRPEPHSRRRHRRRYQSTDSARL